MYETYNPKYQNDYQTFVTKEKKPLTDSFLDKKKHTETDFANLE